MYLFRSFLINYSRLVKNELMTTSKKTEILFVNVLARDDNAVTTTFRRSLPPRRCHITSVLEIVYV
jgi:hypothetical protein